MTDTAGRPRPRRPLRVVAVTSGKGGVGKTCVTVNLALTLRGLGREVLIIDGDVGLANVDILLDEAPRWTLHDVLQGERGLDDVLIRSAHGVTVLPGTSGVAEMTALTPNDRLRLLAAVDGLDERFDTVLVDTPAGIGSNAVFFASAAQEVLVVATPEPTSLADAYAMIKVLAKRGGVTRVGLVVNQCAGEVEARQVFERLSLLTARFLPVVLDLVGHVPADPHVREAVMAQTPLVAAYPGAPASRAIAGLADALLMRPPATGSSGRLQFFWHRLLEAEHDLARAGEATAP